MRDYILGLGEASFINISDFVTVQKSFPWMQTFSIWIIVLPYIWQLFGRGFYVRLLLTSAAKKFF